MISIDQDNTIEAAALVQEFEGFVRASDFPCVGAKAALSRGSLKTVTCRSITSAWDDLPMHEALMAWAASYRDDPTLFRSIAFIFFENAQLTEEEFERAMWCRLQSLSDKDAWLEQAYDARVSSNPQDPHFSLSFGGEAYFVVGLHPNASRPARRFSHPVIVFNLHDQFERLRADGRYETIRETTLARDFELAGSANPMLARHGSVSEAAQYSGRAVDEKWKCPFSNPRMR